MTTPTYLLVDDDEDDLEIFALALEDARISCHFVTAKNGLEALRLFQADPGFSPDFIFIDLNMPFMNGKQFLTEIKSSKGLQHIPAIIYTTSSHPKDIEETEGLGASHYLTKPSNVGSLARLLIKIFNKQSLPFLLNDEVKNTII